MIRSRTQYHTRNGFSPSPFAASRMVYAESATERRTSKSVRKPNELGEIRYKRDVFATRKPRPGLLGSPRVSITNLDESITNLQSTDLGKNKETFYIPDISDNVATRTRTNLVKRDIEDNPVIVRTYRTMSVS